MTYLKIHECTAGGCNITYDGLPTCGCVSHIWQMTFAGFVQVAPETQASFAHHTLPMHTSIQLMAAKLTKYGPCL